MELPEAKGTYVLIAFVAQTKRLVIGHLGTFTLAPGFYAYVGSGFGAGGLRARLSHHLESTADPHWHIDYLLQCAMPFEIWFTTASNRLERQWVELFEKDARFRMPIPRFGSSDYHRSRSSHLFYSKRRPSFRWFEQIIGEQFDGIEVTRFVCGTCQTGSAER